MKTGWGSTTSTRGLVYHGHFVIALNLINSGQCTCLKGKADLSWWWQQRTWMLCFRLSDCDDYELWLLWALCHEYECVYIYMNDGTGYLMSLIQCSAWVIAMFWDDACLFSLPKNPMQRSTLHFFLQLIGPKKHLFIERKWSWDFLWMFWSYAKWLCTGREQKMPGIESRAPWKKVRKHNSLQTMEYTSDEPQL